MHEIELDTAILPVGEQIFQQSESIGRFCRTELGEQAAAFDIIDRTAIIRIDETQVPQLGSLIDIGNSRRNDFHQGLAERVEYPATGDLPDKRHKFVEKTILFGGRENDL